MAFSLNEIEVTGKRAARGAGLDWGIAEEAGKASRWLAARGLPGAEMLAALLVANEGRGYDEIAPVSGDADPWRAGSGLLCPLTAGAALADRAAEVAAGRRVALGPVALPLLLVPYAATCARQQGVTVRVAWEGAELTVSPDGGLAVDGEVSAVTAAEADGVTCGITAVTEPTLHPGVHPGGAGCEVGAEAWDRLNAFARRTFAPATEASRNLGAGAGLVDND